MNILRNIAKQFNAKCWLSKRYNYKSEKFNSNLGMAPTTSSVGEQVEKLIKENRVMIFSKSTCPFCSKVKELFTKIGERYETQELNQIKNGQDMHQYLINKTKQRTVPNVFVKGEHIGGCDDTFEAQSNGKLKRLLQETKPSHEFEYDLVCIGGGSGGLACAKEAAAFGKKVCVLDYVTPTPKGTKWGLGGTCVNVGCIPKKLMHQTAILGESAKDAEHFGWPARSSEPHSWEKMVGAIQNYIGSLNWGYRVQLRDKQVQYLNKMGKLVDAHTLDCTDKKGRVQRITTDKVVVAVGGRPRYPNIPGAKEFCLTSDDLFSLPYNPGKTLLIGASYVSLECAGFLHGIGVNTTVMVRSILLRGFDSDMANRVGNHMSSVGINFIWGSVPTKVEEIENGTPGKLRVHYQSSEKGESRFDDFNTVIFAIGRDAVTKDIGLDKIGVKLNQKNDKIITNNEKSSVDWVYAIGDCIDEKSMPDGKMLELTPVAIKTGMLLARRLFNNDTKLMDYRTVPTTVFTPLEYGAIGYSEEDALKKVNGNKERLEVYHTLYWPLEWTVPQRAANVCYCKLICDKQDNERVIGFHVAGPNAGEITQGYAVAMKMGATKKDFDTTVGIHPTCSEAFTMLDITKSSGKSIEKGGC
ncbi:hypothetical protein SNEBB_005383 [Seison nebaliae]|nr:hypothetical protein SNEBB_005383 [Seison nebaliae]